MGWFSSIVGVAEDVVEVAKGAYGYVSGAFSNPLVNSLATTAIGLASSYVVNEFMNDSTEIPAVKAIDTNSILKASATDEKALSDAKKKAEDMAGARRGRAATILTGPQGLTNDEDELEIGRKTLLGG